ncbi:MAG: RNA methyltransferase, partial [Flavobacterium sp.]
QIKQPVFGAMLNGENIYQTDFGTEGVVVLGNEGNGIRPEIQQLIQKKITNEIIQIIYSLFHQFNINLFC